MQPWFVIAALFGSIGTFFSNLWSPETPAREVKVRVSLETLETKSPRVGWLDDSITHANTIAGVDNGMPIKSSSFDLKVFQRDPSIPKRFVPTDFAFSFYLPDESTTRYEMWLSRVKPDDRSLTLVKYAPSNFPETVLQALFTQDLNGLNPTRDYSPDRGYQLNDWVHAWDCAVTRSAPSPEHPDELFVIHLREQPIEAYFDDPKMRAIALSIQNHTLTHADLDSLSMEAATKASSRGVTLLHWAVRFHNKDFVRWFLDHKLAIAPLALAQGSPVVMATRWSDPEPLIDLVKLYHEQGGLFRPLELPYLIDDRPDALHVFQRLRGLGLLGEKGVRNSLLEDKQMKLDWPDPVGAAAAEKLRAYLPLMTPDELYPKPGTFSLADDTLEDLVWQRILLNSYRQDSSYSNRIEDTHRLVERLRHDLAYQLGSGSPVTPSGVCYAIEKHFVSERDAERRQMHPDEAPFWSELFTSEAAYESFRHYAKTHPGTDGELADIAFVPAGPLREKLSAIRQDALAGRQAKELVVGAFRFQQSGGHLKLSGVVGSSDAHR